MKVIIPFDDYNETIHTGLNFVGTVLPTWGHSALKNGWKLIEIMTPTEERGCWYKGRLVEPYSGCYVNDSVEFFRGGLRDLSRTLKADSEAHAAGVCVEHFSTKDMAKHYTVKNITLVGKTIPDGASGGTGYDEYAHLLVEYYNGESQKATVGYYYQNVNLVFQQLYDKLFGCENPEDAHELLYGAIKDFVPAADFNALPDKYKSPKRENAAPRKHYRIRKLTPTECLRLMKVSDDDIAKMKAAGISDSQLYKLAGNSIVVCVLEAIFTQMFRNDDGCLF